MTGSLADSFLRLLDGLKSVKLRYLITGSFASGWYGVFESFQDIDLVVDLGPGDIQPLLKELQSDFYIVEDQIRTAIAENFAFNVIHLQSAFKVDIFPLTADRYQQAQLARRRFVETTMFSPEPIELAVISPEDSILSKLHWYRKGNCVSTTQWSDVLGVIAVQRDRLDMPYLREWAAYLKVDDLLEQALAERHESS